MNRRVGNPTHGGVGGRRGQPRLPPDFVALTVAYLEMTQALRRIQFPCREHPKCVSSMSSSRDRAISRGADCLQRFHKCLALLATQASENRCVCALRFRFGRFQYFTSHISQPHHVGPRILPTATALQQALSHHAPDQIRNRRSVNACRLNNSGLGWIVAMRDAQQHSELSRCQIRLINLLGEDFIGAL